ncbi:suppressor of fused domain protein [Pseudomonas sp. GM80]|uniref:suppressor of fused domain protein n=1 Tax=Pseudomonas sp. GM80 TaxID=1144339 RepID=UPI00026F9E51|nr:suppressor of fused domain protein [Pseudomonas sp. GM80]EJN21868.1 Suppressor of fused protein (SUFU) [Pseudomonas sp. GM80]
MEFFKKLFASKKKPELPSAQPVDESFSELDLSEAEKANLAAREASQACLDRHWNAVGVSERDVLGYMISPSFMGGPDWPSTRQAYRIVRRGDSIILASEGLSDPFDDPEERSNGFEMELFVETADIPEHARGALGDVAPLQQSWAFEMLKHIAATVANAGGITGQLQQYGALSLELPGFSQSHYMSDQLPAQFVTEDDMVGVLLGAPQPDFPTLLEDMPLSPVKLVPVVLITAAELEYVRAGGQTARQDLIARLQAAGAGHLSNLNRASVV